MDYILFSFRSLYVFISFRRPPPKRAARNYESYSHEQLAYADIRCTRQNATNISHRKSLLDRLRMHMQRQPPSTHECRGFRHDDAAEAPTCRVSQKNTTASLLLMSRFFIIPASDATPRRHLMPAGRMPKAMTTPAAPSRTPCRH